MLTSLPVNLIRAVRRFTPEQAAPVRALNPLLLFAMRPETKTFFFFSIRLSNPHQYTLSIIDLASRKLSKTQTAEIHTMQFVRVSWMVEDLEKDEIPRDPTKRIAEGSGEHKASRNHFLAWS